jgi:hypothetical protein
MTIQQPTSDPTAESAAEPTCEGMNPAPGLPAKGGKRAATPKDPMKKTASVPATKKTSATKTAPKAQKLAPRAAVERVPAQTVLALIAELKLTKTQLAQATGKSNSLVSEWVGKGRSRLVSAADWAAYETAARKFAKEGTK